MKKIDYSKLFTKRKDGCYQKYVNGKYLYSKDPEVLYQKWQEALNGPPEKTFDKVADEWEAVHREEIGIRTWNNYRPHYEEIKYQHKDVPIKDVSPQDILTDLVRHKAKGCSATIVKTRKAIYSSIFDYAMLKNYVQFNPAASVKLPKGLPKGKRTAPTEKEMEVVFNSIDIPFGFFPFFLLCTGLRKSEALALEKKDINWKTKEIRIEKELIYIDGSNPSVKRPKTEAGVREVPIITVLEKPLAEYLENIKGQKLFPAAKSNRNPGGGYMTEKGYDVAWKKYCDLTGLNITAHQLRHGTATLMFESGVDVYTAQKVLGHANVSTTMEIYTELRDKQKDKSIKKFNKGVTKYISKKG